MRAEDMKDEEMVLLLKKEGHSKRQTAQNLLLDEVFNFRYLHISLNHIHMICVIIVL